MQIPMHNEMMRDDNDGMVNSNISSIIESYLSL